MKRKTAILILCFCSAGLFALSAWAETPSFPFLARVVKDNVNIRAGQSKSFEKVGQLELNEKVVVVEKQYSWYRIKLPAHAKSYISKDFVALMREQIARVSGDRVNIRSGPGVNYSLLGQAEKGTFVRVLDEIDGWYRIEPIDDSYGWVREDFLAFKSQAIPPPRTVALPTTKNVYERKRLAEAQKAQDNDQGMTQQPSPAASSGSRPGERISVTGIVKELGDNKVAADIRHRLLLKDGSSYYLKGYRRVIDGFLNHKVMIEGEVQPDIEAQHPVLLVTKIRLVL